MIIQLPKQAQRIYLPKEQGKNAAWDYLKSIDGNRWLLKNCPSIAIGLTKNGKCLAYILFNDAVFTVHYACHINKAFHYGMAWKNAAKFRGKDADELGLLVKRFDIRYDENRKPFLRKNNYEIMIEL